MRIIFNEIKKVFEIKMVALLMLMSFIFYFLFISSYIDYFPGGRPDRDHYNISIQMLEDYGRFMEDGDFQHFKGLYEEDIQKANQYLQSNEKAIEVGLTTYEEFRSIDFEREDLYKVWRTIIFEEQVDVFWELQVRENLITSYEHKENFKEGYEFANEKQKQRVEEVIEEGLITSIFPYLVYENYRNLIKYVSILILISIMFMLAPIYLRDRKNNVNYLQYTSKTGRNLFKKKVVAALLSAFIIITVQLLAFFLLYSTNQVEMFFCSYIISIFNPHVFWYNLTFIQYILLTVAGVYVLGLAIALIVISISSIVPNYITMIGGQIPLAFFGISVLVRYLIVRFAHISIPQYWGGISYGIVVVLAIGLIAMRWKKEKTIDIA